MASIKVQSRFALLKIEDDDSDDGQKKDSQTKKAGSQSNAQKKKNKKKKQQQQNQEKNEVNILLMSKSDQCSGLISVSFVTQSFFVNVILQTPCVIV